MLAVRAPEVRQDRVELVEASAESLPFADATFDHLTVTYLLRYVDDPGATLRELARVVRPGGAVASLEFGVPAASHAPRGSSTSEPASRSRAGCCETAGARSATSSGGSIREFWETLPARATARALACSGHRRCRGTAPEPRRRCRHVGEARVSAPSQTSWYALETGGWRDYVTLLHLPYTAWHVSYVVIGGCLAPIVAWGRLGAAVAAFALAVGVGAHALDELRGRPLRTSIPDSVLVALAAVSVGAACAIGVVGAIVFEPWLVLLVPIGAFLVVAYNLELLGGRFHSDLWFGLAWGGFPVVCGYAAVAGDLSVAALLAAAFAVLLSLAQRALSNHVRFVRRRVAAVDGTLELRDGSHEQLDSDRLIRAEERGLRLLAAASVVLAAALVAFRI